jgi:hypothetical protein
MENFTIELAKDCGRESGVFDRERGWLFLLIISCNIAEANLAD